MPSPQELNERFGGSFSDWVNNTSLPHFGDMPSRSLSPTQKMNAVMGYILRQNFESLIKDNRESGKHYLTLVGVRMILIENGPPRRIRPVNYLLEICEGFHLCGSNSSSRFIG